MYNASEILTQILDQCSGTHTILTRPHIQILDTTDSTNSDAANWLRDPSHANIPWGIFVAKHQTQGRGRQGRAFLSKAGDTFTCSFAWRSQQALAALIGLPLAVGLLSANMLRELLKTHSSVDPDALQIKWPNDIWLQGKKLGGILVETQTSQQAGQCDVIIGIGINLRMIDALATLDYSCTSLDAAFDITHLNINILVSQLATAFIKLGHTISDGAIQTTLAQWPDFDALYQRDINVFEQGELQLCGRAIGIDSQGFLLVQTAESMSRVITGDVSIRLQPTSDDHVSSR